MIPIYQRIVYFYMYILPALQLKLTSSCVFRWMNTCMSPGSTQLIVHSWMLDAKFRCVLDFFTLVIKLEDYNLSKQNERNDKFSVKIACLRYTERVSFRPQILKTDMKRKHHQGMGTWFPSS